MQNTPSTLFTLTHSWQVQRFFESWGSGVKPKAYPAFSKDNSGDLANKYADSPSIKALVNKSDRFDKLIKAALDRLNNSSKRSKQPAAPRKTFAQEAAVMIEPSSEPEYSESEAMDDDDDDDDEVGAGRVYAEEEGEHDGETESDSVQDMIVDAHLVQGGGVVKVEEVNDGSRRLFDDVDGMRAAGIASHQLVLERTVWR